MKLHDCENLAKTKRVRAHEVSERTVWDDLHSPSGAGTY